VDDKKVQFFPFNAINDFMRPDYRLEVVRVVLNALPGLPEELRAHLDRLTRKIVQVSGFRNSAKAPVNLRVRPTAEAFEKNPHLVASILAAWSYKHTTLQQQVYSLLISRNWDILPPDADRTKLPGFLTKWPRNENFDTLNIAFTEKFPEAQFTKDDISLMTVWLSNRLPYNLSQEEESQETPIP
jgi:hypothetical protein